jgi:hypothetical protein
MRRPHFMSIYDHIDLSPNDQTHIIFQPDRLVRTVEIRKTCRYTLAVGLHGQ